MKFKGENPGDERAWMSLVHVQPKIWDLNITSFYSFQVFTTMSDVPNHVSSDHWEYSGAVRYHH